MKARIINGKDWGGNYTQDYLDNNSELVSQWVLTEILPNGEKTPEWNGSFWYESYVEVIEIPQQVHNHKLRMALINFGVMPSSIDMAIEAMTDLTMKEKIYTLWNFAPMLERADTSLNYMATQFEISQPNLDQIFIYANSLK